MIAEVIVDVAAYPINRPFDYIVPDHLVDIIEAGCRVKVPFGPRKVVGYVVGVKETTDLTSMKLKSIVEMIDLQPILSAELLQLAKWVSNETLAYEIDALQVMLPAAMRAKYEKVIYIEQPEKLDEETRKIVNGRTVVPFEQFEKAQLLKVLKEYAKERIVSVDTVVRQQTAVKKIRVLHIASIEILQTIRAALATNATKQNELMEWLLSFAGETVTAKYAMEQAGVQSAVIKALADKGALVEEYVETYREPTVATSLQSPEHVQLTNEQQIALQAVTNALRNKRAETFLLHGVTGSGKTEVYLRAIKEVIDKGQEAIVLVPEISLTPQMTARFKGRFGEQVAVMHSGLSAGEKYDEWRKIHRGEVKVAVGARSAVFAPFTNLGIIILDEEHESTYKQEDTPRYHARDVAIWRSQFAGCPVMLGSATPSLESYARAKKGVYTLLTLSHRAQHQSLPHVTVVDMREQLKAGNRSMFSVELREAIEQRLERREQTVLFLNKRGFSSFVLCRDCGTVVQCPNCDISLTYHRANERLKCHYCNYEEPVPHNCPECSSEHIRFFGTGTQKAEEELAKLVPEARVLRMDVDTTRKKGSHERILEAFGEGKADILLGTQMIAKGLDFPRITLVGVLAADTTLHLPDFRAAEKTFQLLTQVSGRAGRHDLPGEVIVQTYTPEHYAIELAKAQQYVPFYEQEMLARKQVGYPPFYFITLVQFSHEDLVKVADYAERATQFLRSKLTAETVIIGPTAAQVSRVNNRYRYQSIVKYKKEPNLIGTLQQLIKMYRTDWMKDGLLLSVDVDPASIY